MANPTARALLPLTRLRRHTLALLEDKERENQQHRWNSNVYFEHRTVEFLLMTDRLLRLGLLPIKRFLEVGCGIGWTLLLWAQISAEAVGVDLPDEVEKARRLIANRNFCPSNVALAPSSCENFQKGERYDLILTQYVLEHVAEIEAVLANLKQHLEPEAQSSTCSTVRSIAWNGSWSTGLTAPRSAESLSRCATADCCGPSAIRLTSRRLTSPGSATIRPN
ncbi:MAG TPA: class I SAM-dependent methyltransferase [Bryobacteraceae bacterium]|nr:class I SAM-dependent methyltransferase [Bryobacteraceae bacterium]